MEHNRNNFEDKGLLPTNGHEHCVPVHEHNRDVKRANSKGFAKGFFTAVVVAVLGVTVMYLVSGFGSQYEYEIVEPDFNAPELRDDIIKKEGDIDGGDADINKIDE